MFQFPQLADSGSTIYLKQLKKPKKNISSKKI